MPMLAVIESARPDVRAEVTRLMDHLEQALCDQLGAGVEVCPVEQHDELVAGQPRRRIRFPDRRTHPLGDVSQELIPGRVAEGVVDVLEAVDVDVQRGHRESGPGAPVRASARLDRAPARDSEARSARRAAPGAAAVRSSRRPSRARGRETVRGPARVTNSRMLAIAPTPNSNRLPRSCDIPFARCATPRTTTRHWPSIERFDAYVSSCPLGVDPADAHRAHCCPGLR